ncbi:MAG TPA: signal peptidase II [Candidatus Limnocylindrales bacterium]
MAADRAEGAPGSGHLDDATGAGAPLWAPFVVIAAAVVVADQVTKAWLVGMLGPGESLRVLGDWLRLVHTRNTGAVFGLFRDQAPLFAAVSLGVVGLIAWFHGRSGRSPMMTLALGLLLGGAIGNLVDRLRFGYVVDFVDAGIGGVRFYTFNVADSAISAALLLLILVGLRPSLARPSGSAAVAGRPSPNATDDA